MSERRQQEVTAREANSPERYNEIAQVRWEGIERRLGGGIAKQLREVGVSVREVNFGSLYVAVKV